MHGVIANATYLSFPLTVPVMQVIQIPVLINDACG